VTAPLAAVVLAGGASRRMGRDKAILPYQGSTLVEHVVDVVGERCAPVFVIAAPGQYIPAVNAEVLRDDVRGVGPLVATGRGLRAAAEAGAQWTFVCAVDMPFIDPALIDVLVDSSKNLTADVVLPWDGRDHYLAGLYRVSLVGRINELVASGESSMAALVNSVDAQRIVLSNARSLTNVNSAADLALLR
jgi:molybdopterin-guanine dinucleotide biosynthesis protein A